MSNKVGLVEVLDELETLKRLIANLKATVSSSSIAFSSPNQLVGSNASGAQTVGRLINDSYIDDQSISTIKIIDLDADLTNIYNILGTSTQPTEHDFSYVDDNGNLIPESIQTMLDIYEFYQIGKDLWNSGKWAYNYFKGVAPSGSPFADATKFADVSSATTAVKDATTGLSATNAKAISAGNDASSALTKSTKTITDLTNDIGYDTGSGKFTKFDNLLSKVNAPTTGLDAATSAAASAGSIATGAASAASSLGSTVGGFAGGAFTGIFGILAGIGAIFSSSSTDSNGNTTYTQNQTALNYNTEITNLKTSVTGIQTSITSIQTVNTRQDTLLTALVNAGYATLSGNIYTLTDTGRQLCPWMNQVLSALVTAGILTSSVSGNTTTYAFNTGFTSVGASSSSITQLQNDLVTAGIYTKTGSGTSATYAYNSAFFNTPRSIYYGIVTGNYSSNFQIGDHFKFNNYSYFNGTNITLDTSTTYTSSTNQASIGRFTLKAGKSYKCIGSANDLAFNSTSPVTTAIAIQWYNSDTGTLIGQPACIVTATSDTGRISNGPAIAFISPSVNTRIELQITANYPNSANSTTAVLTDVYGSPFGLIEEISPNMISGTPVGIAPTVQKFLSGSGTYTLPTSNTPTYIRVRMVGAGGGGSAGGQGGSAVPANGTTGGNTTFGSFLTANGGVGGDYKGGTVGTGGSFTINSPAIGFGIQGSSGGSQLAAGANGFAAGLYGGTSFFGGAGTTNGASAIANTGSGGAAGSGNNTSNGYSGSGGGSGGYVEAIIPNPASSYSYSIGTKGTGSASPGSGAGAGGNGADGIIIVEEYYTGGTGGSAATTDVPDLTNLISSLSSYITTSGTAPNLTITAKAIPDSANLATLRNSLVSQGIILSGTYNPDNVYTSTTGILPALTIANGLNFIDENMPPFLNRVYGYWSCQNLTNIKTINGYGISSNPLVMVRDWYPVISKGAGCFTINSASSGPAMVSSSCGANFELQFNSAGMINYGLANLGLRDGPLRAYTVIIFGRFNATPSGSYLQIFGNDSGSGLCPSLYTQGFGNATAALVSGSGTSNTRIFATSGINNTDYPTGSNVSLINMASNTYYMFSYSFGANNRAVNNYTFSGSQYTTATTLLQQVTNEVDVGINGNIKGRAICPDGTFTAYTYPGLGCPATNSTGTPTNTPCPPLNIVDVCIYEGVLNSQQLTYYRTNFINTKYTNATLASFASV